MTYGNYNAPLWVILPKLSNKALERRSISADGIFFELNKWLTGLDYYLLAKYNKNDNKSPEEQGHSLLQEITKRKPPFILALEDEVLTFLAPQTLQKGEKKALNKWAGSLLQSELFNWRHYIMGTYSPETIFGQYELKDIVLNLDIGKLKAEIEHYKKMGVHDSLPSRELITCLKPEEAITELTSSLGYIMKEKISVDIETLRPKFNSSIFDEYHPGIPYTLGIAFSPMRAISFPLWEWPIEDTMKILRVVANLFNEVPTIGQNIYNFDLYFLESLGFSFKEIIDIRIRHHILWPELSHKLMFMTRQYTREPYYKDDGKNYVPRNDVIKRRLLRYNALDAAITYEIYNAQEEELKERGLV